MNLEPLCCVRRTCAKKIVKIICMLHASRNYLFSYHLCVNKFIITLYLSVYHAFTLFYVSSQIVQCRCTFCCIGSFVTDLATFLQTVLVLCHSRHPYKSQICCNLSSRERLRSFDRCSSNVQLVYLPRRSPVGTITLDNAWETGWAFGQ